MTHDSADNSVNAINAAPAIPIAVTRQHYDAGMKRHLLRWQLR
ncbi:MAG: hypothetical protein V3T12_01840 [Acidiferrobacterales bacterium]|jgi:hypothetical protein